MPAVSLDKSLMLGTALVPRLGYEEVSAIAGKAQAENITLRAAAPKLDLLGVEVFDALVRPEDMLRPMRS